MRVKIVKQHKKYDKGETVDVTRNEAFGLIDGGYAIVTGDFTQQDADNAKEKAKEKKKKLDVKEK
jgi:VIT1/CCC1 family predicted Fe2+/Mn2+ transporter